MPVADFDAQFNQSATVENKTLAKLSIEAATFAYDDYLWLRSREPFRLHKMLRELGFGDISSYNYGDNNEDNVSFTLAHKQLATDETLVSVVVRGTDTWEWKGNFKLWENANTPSELHYSFDKARASVLTQLATYIKTNGLDSSNMKLWITGHSRGAAVANLLSAGLVEKNGLSNYEIEQGSIFAYTFATPNVKTIVDEAGMRLNYRNIFNYVNGEDFVGQVPIEKWNYGKYGITKWFPSTIEINSTRFVNDYLAAGRIGFIVDPGETYKGLRAFLKASNSVDEYYNKTFDPQNASLRTLFEATYQVISEGAMNNTSLEYILNAVDGVVGLASLNEVFRFFASNSETTIFYAHTPETYYAYMTK